MNRLFVVLFFLVTPLFSFAQIKNLSSFVEAQIGYTSKNTVPFWLRSNQYGSIPSDGASLSLIAGVRKDYDTSKHLIQLGFSLIARANAGQASSFKLIEGYGKMGMGIFEIKAGREKEFMGLADTSLTSGPFSVSGNALGIPKVQFGIPAFSNVFGGKLFAFKGNFAHGWIGKVAANPYVARAGKLTAFYHQSALYGRFGKPGWKLKLYAGINHEVMWSNEKVSENGLQPGLQTFWYVVTGKTYDRFSKVGNHIGSVDLGFEYDFKNFTLFAYRQNFYDAGALGRLANINDGLNGISISNKKQANKKFKWNKILFEILNTRNQAGYPWSPATNSGDEDYYNNYLYIEGWTYKQMNIGSPFLTTQATAKEDLAKVANQYFVNNRVLAFHLGFEGSIKKLHITAKTSYSQNYGTFGTSEYQNSGRVGSPAGFIFKKVPEFSAFCEGSRDLKSGWNAGIIAAFDAGGLLPNAAGVIFKISKTL